MARWDKILEKLLPAVSTDAERAVLRSNPEKYQQYLEALSQKYGPQADRAKNMGFNPDTYYHGTANADINEFRPARVNSVIDDKSGSYFSPNPEAVEGEANWKAEQGLEKSFHPKRVDELVQQGMDEDQAWKQAYNEMDQMPKTGQSIYPVKIHPDYTHKFEDYGVPSKSVLVENPGVRSTNAAFDPRFKHSSDILAGLAGGAALGTAALMTPDEANAAGVQTIMSKLGISLEDAVRVKNLAQRNIPQDVFEQNIRAIKDVKGYKQTPEAYPLIGRGMDYNAVSTPGGQILKAPRGNRGNVDPTAMYAPSLVEQAGLGPKTKTIQAGDKTYMLQDRITPLDTIEQKTRRPGGDPFLENYYAQRDKLTDVNIPLSEINQEKVQRLDDLIKKRENTIFAQQGIDPKELESQYSQLTPQDRGQFYNINDKDPSDMFKKLLEIDAKNKLEPYITPQDLHEGNIGLSSEGKPAIFDTSRFKNFRPANLSPEEIQRIMEANVALPEQKALLRNKLENPQPDDFPRGKEVNSDDGTTAKIHNMLGMFSPTDTEKVAAGIGGASALGGLASGSNQATAESINPLPSIERGMNYIREPISNATRSATDALISGTTPLQGQEKEQYMQSAAPQVLGGAAQMATDPFTYIPGGPELDMAMQFPKLKNYLQGK